ncbi:MAG: polyprenyl synthetase family protein, partial [Candidatus Nitrotoga sp.]
MSFEAIKQSLAQDMATVDRVIRVRLHSDVALINQMSEYIINGGGKRLRPALVVLSAKALGYTGEH